MSSILNSIKKLLGPGEDYDHFNPDIIIHINAAFARLCTLGVGPSQPFRITSETEQWNDFISDFELSQEDVKQYIYLYVKRAFDPPGNSFLMDSINDQINKLEWLMNSVAEVGY